MRVELAGLRLSDPAASWAALGFEVAGRDCWVGGVRVRLGEPGRGIVGWVLRGVAGGFRQGFRRLGPAILELVQARDAPPGPARFWGLVVVVTDLERLARDLGDRLGPVHAAVQPGRRIATLRPSAGLLQAVAFMDPEVSGGGRQ